MYVMKKIMIDMGILSAFFDYTIEDDVAVIHKLMIGGANAVRYPLTDWFDAKNFSELLSKEIGLDVIVKEVSAS